MAQHDYFLDNNDGATFRGDLNAALAAIMTGNSGPAAPAVTAPFMPWFDTANGVLKIRNQGDTAWVPYAEGIGSGNTGAVSFFAMSTAPSGWLKANGALVSRSTYSALFAVIGTTYGAGDGSTTFALPDARGEFLRAWSDGSSVDSGRELGSKQVATGIGSYVDQYSGSIPYTGADSTDSVALNYYPIGGSITTGVWIRTKPRNIAFLACIKY